MATTTITHLTPYRSEDLVFSRRESPAFRLVFAGLDEATFASCTFTAEVRRSPRLAPIASWDVTTDPAARSVTFSLTADVTAALPDIAVYEVLIEPADRVPMGGRMILRTTREC